MRKLPALLGSAVFLVIAPGFVAGLVPWWLSRWQLQPPFLGTPLFRYAGGMLIALGLYGLLDSFLRFALQGLGTPAPVLPPDRLVVTGLYCYVRNPMYVAILSMVIGQGLLLGNRSVLEYGAAIWLAFYLFVLGYEEPTLRGKFAEQYKIYCRAVPRWIPRITPWTGNSPK